LFIDFSSHHFQDSIGHDPQQSLINHTDLKHQTEIQFMTVNKRCAHKCWLQNGSCRSARWWRDPAVTWWEHDGPL